MSRVRVFPCPRCNEFISTDADRCRFCATPIDKQAAQLAADVQDKENVRYMRRRYARHMVTGGAIFLVATAFSVATLLSAVYAETGGYVVLVYGLILYGAGDFIYGLTGVSGLLR